MIGFYDVLQQLPELLFYALDLRPKSLIDLQALVWPAVDNFFSG